MNYPVWKIIAFIVFSFVLVYISRRSLRAPRSHGFYRFFAWEFILALFLLNVNAWFQNPGSWYQVISWFLLIVSIVPLVLGIQALRTRGKPTQQRDSEPQLLAFEKTSALVTIGIYHYIRHPLYSSLLLLNWGIFFKAPSGLGIFLASGATVFLILTAQADEAECIRFFGPDYQKYMKQTKRFIPFVY
jgi:protein-S-isoprenylcysteine O-methyltransferase Ste14